MSNCIQLGRKMKTWYCWYATWAQKEVGVPQIWEVPMKCCHAGRENEIITSEMLSTIRNEMETRSSRADRTNFGNEDIEWCLFCWHRDGWRLMRIPYASFCMLFSTFIPLITDDMNKLSFLTWLPTFAHIANKSSSLENIGYVACSVTPSATYPTEMFRCDILERCGSRVIFNTGVLVLTLLVLCNLKSTSPCCPVSPPFRCPWHRMSNCIQLGRKMKTWYCWYATWAQKEVGEVPMKCCHAGRENEIITSEMLSTIRNEMETRSSRADRTNFGNEDIEWCLFCWHRDGWRLMRIPYASFCMLFSTFIPLITDDMNKLSFLTWLPTFAHIANKSSSLENIGYVACSVTPSATYPTEMFRCDILEKFQSKTDMYWFVIPRY